MGIWRPLKVFVLNIEGLSVRLMLTKRYLFKLGNSQMKCCELPYEALISTLPHPSLNLTWNFFICFPGNKTIWKLKWQVSEIAVDIVEVLNSFLFIQTTACEFENQLFSNLSGVLFLKTHRKQNSSSLLTITIWESCKNKFGDQLPVSSKHHN